MSYKGTIFQCGWCGERKTSKSEFCRLCSHKNSKVKNYQENKAIFEENEKKGYVNPIKKHKRFPLMETSPNCLPELEKVN